MNWMLQLPHPLRSRTAMDLAIRFRLAMFLRNTVVQCEKDTMNQITLIQTLNNSILEAERQGQTRYRTAKLARLNPGALSRFMAGKGKPTIATIQAVAQAFRKRVEFDLVDHEDATK